MSICGHHLPFDNPQRSWTADVQSCGEVVQSCLVEGRRGMKRAMLEVIASRSVVSIADVQRYISWTLLAATAKSKVLSLLLFSGLESCSRDHINQEEALPSTSPSL